ncbi:MAG TPA: TIGR03435 family protein [Acidobacteriaceae bacterium]|nr:TIGR03435 family protein [Acidobacteriaceae bacterium]
MAMVSLKGFSQPVPTGAVVQAAPAELPKWDVVSVKPAQMPCGGPSSLMPTRAGIEIECLPPQALLKFIFGINEDSRILGGPSWLKQASYGIEAKVGGTEVAAYSKLSRKERSLMLQDLLADRFAMKWHRETRDLPVYALVIAKGGSKLKESQPEETAKGAMFSKGQGEVDAVASSLEALPMFLTRELDRPVVDRTGLTGRYDFTLRFAPGPSAQEDSDAASIFTAVEEQLGLKLEPSRAPLDVLVIDHIEKPSAN